MSEGERVGRFELIAAVGSGPSGTVWRGRDEVGDRPVAIKRMDLPAEGDSLARLRLAERHQREVDVVRRSSLSGVAPILGAGFEPEEVWVATPLYAEPSLADLLAQGGPVRPRALELLRGMADALDACHQRGIVHRGVKPGNLFVTGEGPIWLDLTRPESPGTSVLEEDPAPGAVLYMSPEEMLGASPTAASNRYSFAVLAHRMVAGRLPHDPADLVEYMYATAYGRIVAHDGLPGGIRESLTRSLSREPAERHSSCRAMIDELRRELPGPPVPFPERPGGMAEPAPWQADEARDRRHQRPFRLLTAPED